jgi:hypothetical protein
MQNKREGIGKEKQKNEENLTRKNNVYLAFIFSQKHLLIHKR